MESPELGRRAFLGGTVATAALATAAPKTVEASGAGFVESPMKYEVVRSDAQWRARLDDIEYFVLREVGTEAPRSSSLWNNTEPGVYSCKGCDLKLYESFQKVELERGWVFFKHSEPNAVLTDLDFKGGRMNDIFAQANAWVEVHCRRCGSHLGHFVALPEVKGRPLHCINGFSLNFTPAAA